MRTRRGRVVAGIAVVLLSSVAAPAVADPAPTPGDDCVSEIDREALTPPGADAADQPVGTTRLVSVDPSGGVGDLGSYSGAPSDDGSLVAFTSYATDLVSGDTNDASDIFVRDRRDHSTTKISEAPGGGQANDRSSGAAITPDGRFVAFFSHATNLVADDTNGREDVFLFDRSTRVTTLVSHSTTGGSASGQSFSPSISANGQYVTYYSTAHDIVHGDAGALDVFVWDRFTDLTVLISRGLDGEPAKGNSYYPDISGDGRYVTFSSDAKNLVGGLQNRKRHVYLYDRVADTTVRVDQTPLGAPGNRRAAHRATISRDGTHVAFGSRARNLSDRDSNYYADVFVYDIEAGTIELITHAYDGGPADEETYYEYSPSISADGRYVAFNSYASNLVSDDLTSAADAFVYDRTTDTATLISRTRDGQANRTSFDVEISADGRFVSYDTYADNLFDGDDNACMDVFIYRQS